MSSRGRRDIRRERSTGTAVEPDEVDGEEPEGDLTVDQTPASSLDDLTTPADPGEFTQTFTDDDALLDLQGAFDPTAGAKQVIPRIAYTINFNFVWNPDRGRWEPDEGNANSGFVVRDSGTVTVGPSSTVQALTGLTVPDVDGNPLIVAYGLATSASNAIEFEITDDDTTTGNSISVQLIGPTSGNVYTVAVTNTEGVQVTVSYAVIEVRNA